MSFSMYAASAPVFARSLGNLLKILDKAQAHAEAKKFEPSVYMTLRLAPDMLAFPRQIQIATDTAKGCVARLAGIEIPKYEDDEATLDDLRARLRKTIDFVQSVPADKFADAEGRDVELPRRSGEPIRFKGDGYLVHFALPNFYFHVTTAYALLRQAGVEIGKMDYLGQP